MRTGEDDERAPRANQVAQRAGASSCRRAKRGGAMSYSVGQVARLAAVSVRTLHHYHEIGLLTPSGQTPAGYRQYSADDLERLQRVLFYRELGFALDEIVTILDDPAIDAAAHLRRQRELLTRRI